MTGIHGLWHDGDSSASLPAMLNAKPHLNRLRLTGVDFKREYSLDATRVSARVANIPRRLEFTDRACFETQDNDAIDAIFNRTDGRQAVIHWLESHIAWVMASLLCTGLIVWAMLAFGIPYLAERTAYTIPTRMEAEMGAQTLQALDTLAFKPTQLSAEQQARGRRLLQALPGGTVHLEFRVMGTDIANAFTLPGGTIVVTDHLIELADTDEELQAVFAHELGHVHYHHPIRAWLQNSATALLMAAVIGDVSSIAANVAVLPTLLLQNRYSRAFEEQADDFAAQLLQTRGISPCRLGAILHKLETSMKDESKDVPDFLSTHPATDKRIEHLEEHGEQCR
jgi:predicted Zn-dependent protease